MLQLENVWTAGTGRWLVLLYQLPTRPSSARVRIWRRLQDVGAVQVRQSAYVLPHRDAAREDLEWVRSEIAGLGGAATVFTADAVDAATDAELVAACRDARERDLARLRRRASRSVAGLTRAAARQQPPSPAQARAARALVAQFRALKAVTYFETPRLTEMEDIVQQIIQHAGGRRRSEAAPAVTRPAATSEGYRGRTWVTRPRPGVDRMATAWLIRTHIDPQAVFAFADTPPAGAVPFDMYGVEFGHQGDRCSFEVVAERFGVRAAGVDWIGRVVHDIDLRESRYAEPETAGVALMIDGLRRTHADDRALLEHGITLFESLAQARADLAPDRAVAVRARQDGQRAVPGSASARRRPAAAGRESSRRRRATKG
jgi:hypothetical protein